MRPQQNHTTLSQRFEALRPQLKLWATRLLGSKEDAEDALQDTFFRLWRQKDSITGQQTMIDAMSVTALRSVCIDSLRKRNIRRTEPIETSERVIDTTSDAMADLVEEVRVLINEQLPSRHKEVLLLHDSLGYDYNEIADKLGITEANARVILSRARKAVREAYKRQQQLPPTPY